MVDFLRTSKISSRIEDIIVEAKEHITFVTPYLKFTKTLYERLVEKDDEGVKIRFVYGKTKLLRDQEQLLKKLKNISIYFLENLHAKCYINEFAGVVTSMNLYDFSEKTNREMGVYFKRTDNESFYSQVYAEVESIIKASTLENNSFFTTSSKVYNHSDGNPFSDFFQKQSSPNTIPLTYNQRLKEKLSSEYKYSNFEYLSNADMIICNDFGEFFKLEIEPKGSYYRIDFRLAGNEFSSRSEHFNILYDHRSEIERNFPKNVVNWGNQMKRIKFDFNQDCNELNNCDELVYFNWIKTIRQLLESLLRSALQTKRY